MGELSDQKVVLFNLKKPIVPGYLAIFLLLRLRTIQRPMSSQKPSLLWILTFRH